MRIHRLAAEAATPLAPDALSEYTRFALQERGPRAHCLGDRRPSATELARLALHHRLWQEERRWPYLVTEDPSPGGGLSWVLGEGGGAGAGRPRLLVRLPRGRTGHGGRLAPPGTLAYVVESEGTRDALLRLAVPYQVPVDTLFGMLADLGELVPLDVRLEGGPWGPRSPRAPSVREAAWWGAAVVLLVTAVLVGWSQSGRARTSQP